MKSITFIYRSLVFYRRTHFAVLLGTIIGTAILTGALIVGDSVRYSLKKLSLSRLGRTEYALYSGERFFQEHLADDIHAATSTDVAAVLKLNGIASAADGIHRANHIQVLGVDHRFWNIGGAVDLFKNLTPDEVIINQALAQRLNVQCGEELLLRIEKVDLLPGDIPFSIKKNQSVAVRLSVKTIATDEQCGRFGLEANQVSPLSVFLPRSFLANKMDLESKANMLLVTDDAHDFSLANIQSILSRGWDISDAGLKIRELTASRKIELTSERIFIEPTVVDAVFKIAPAAQGILTYFVNTIQFKDRFTPYSFIAGLNDSSLPANMLDEEIIINSWLADDLHVTPGDIIEIEYLIPGVANRLEEKVSAFRVRGIIPTVADKSLTPSFPGLSAAENCRDWDPGIPIDLTRIRTKDENYWKKYQGTPRAFITLKAAQRLWANRFGALTAIRIPQTQGITSAFRTQLSKQLAPLTLGFYFQPIKQESIQASNEAIDFGTLFLGLSFFIIAAALLLTGLLFVLGIEQRSSEIGTFTALGFDTFRIQLIFLAEGTIVAAVGALVGTATGVLYNQIVLYALSTVWSGAVGITTLVPYIKLHTLIGGASIGFILAFVAMSIIIWQHTQKTVHELHAGYRQVNPGISKIPAFFNLLLTFFCIAGISIIFILTTSGKSQAAANAFWGAGALMLTGCVALCNYLLQRLQTTADHFRLSLRRLSWRNVARKRGRSLATIALLGASIFIIIGVGANRNNSLQNVCARHSGTGGFALYGETTMPVMEDLNSEQGRKKYGLTENISIVQLRLRDGADASCLNLNRITSPRILSIRPEELAQRQAFSFATLIDGMDRKHPWLNLQREPGDDLIPAIADQHVITWGMGKAVGDTLVYTDEYGQQLKLKLIGGLAGSIFQGSVIIAEENFAACFPSIRGTRVFLIDAPADQQQAIRQSLSRMLQDYGVDLVAAADRLAAFKIVEHTYLSIFLALGGLGLILGTIGLGVIVLRNVMERRSELAILQAIGFNRNAVRKIVLSEHLLLLTLGLCCGVIAAIIAVFPVLRSPGAQVPYAFLLLTFTTIFASGVCWTILAINMALRKDVMPSSLISLTN